MMQSLALLLDSYRELNSKKLFWITMGISLLVVLVFAAFGINEEGMTFLKWQIHSEFLTSAVIPPATFYKFMFAYFGIPIWLTWIATILGLVSTASIFPDFIAGGAIELMLSKPISRIRLFFTKFACGLLFAALQVAVFTVACFFVIGWRGHSWEPALFLAVPIVVVFFSYLFSVCALLGLWTRSTIASLLLTLLVWVGFWAVNTGDSLVLLQRETVVVNAERAQKRLDRAEKAAAETAREAASAKEPSLYTATPQERAEAVTKARNELEKTQENVRFWRRFAGAVYALKTAVPKTEDTIGLLDRWLLTEKERRAIMRQRGDSDEEGDPNVRARSFNGPPDPEVTKRMHALRLARPTWWVIGTSLGFEAVVLGIAAWTFRRRDF